MWHSEYFLASKFDSNKDGVLDADEMQVAQAAFDKGFGQDDFRKYFSFKRPNMTRLDRVLMKTSRTERTSYADTFNRILTDYGTRNSTMFKAPTPVRANDGGALVSEPCEGLGLVSNPTDGLPLAQHCYNLLSDQSRLQCAQPEMTPPNTGTRLWRERRYAAATPRQL